MFFLNLCRFAEDFTLNSEREIYNSRESSNVNSVLTYDLGFRQLFYVPKFLMRQIWILNNKCGLVNVIVENP